MPTPALCSEGSRHTLATGLGQKLTRQTKAQRRAESCYSNLDSILFVILRACREPDMRALQVLQTRSFNLILPVNSLKAKQELYII